MLVGGQRHSCLLTTVYDGDDRSGAGTLGQGGGGGHHVAVVPVCPVGSQKPMRNLRNDMRIYKRNRPPVPQSLC
jgi:hypothetical protein